MLILSIFSCDCDAFTLHRVLLHCVSCLDTAGSRNAKGEKKLDNCRLYNDILFIHFQRDHSNMVLFMILMAVGVIFQFLQLLSVSLATILSAIFFAFLSLYFFLCIYSLYDMLKKENTGRSNAWVWEAWCCETYLISELIKLEEKFLLEIANLFFRTNLNSLSKIAQH